MRSLVVDVLGAERMDQLGDISLRPLDATPHLRPDLRPESERGKKARSVRRTG
ncbi:hypothetical protein [Streptomyces sp. NPDC058086]|uniref:hypothetical protein n=1 Tax=Streptomyces sp. NPDC058086 TaxID=3346334 RepID=UPI0036EE57B1